MYIFPCLSLDCLSLCLFLSLDNLYVNSMISITSLIDESGLKMIKNSTNVWGKGCRVL